MMQETYPQMAPIWFSESEDSTITATIEKLGDCSPQNYNVCIVKIPYYTVIKAYTMYS